MLSLIVVFLFMMGTLCTSANLEFSPSEEYLATQVSNAIKKVAEHPGFSKCLDTLEERLQDELTLHPWLESKDSASRKAMLCISLLREYLAGTENPYGFITSHHSVFTQMLSSYQLHFVRNRDFIVFAVSPGDYNTLSLHVSNDVLRMERKRIFWSYSLKDEIFLL